MNSHHISECVHSETIGMTSPLVLEVVLDDELEVLLPDQRPLLFFSFVIVGLLVRGLPRLPFVVEVLGVETDTEGVDHAGGQDEKLEGLHSEPSIY